MSSELVIELCAHVFFGRIQKFRKLRCPSDSNLCCLARESKNPNRYSLFNRVFQTLLRVSFIADQLPEPLINSYFTFHWDILCLWRTGK